MTNRDSSTNLVITRGGIGGLASLIGFSGLIAGIILLIWLGNVGLPVLTAFAVGLIGIIAWARLLPDDFRAFITGRGVRHSTVTIFAGVLLVGVIVMLYLLVARAALTWDLTVGGRFTLSDTTRTVLQRVPRPIQITGFYTARSLGLREIDDQYWRLYESDSDGLIRRAYYDPEEVPALAQQFGVTADPQVFISFLNPDGSVDFSLVSRVAVGNEQEREMTTAISRLIIAGSITVYFDVGLGERDPLDNTQEGLSGINNGMRESGLITLPLDIGSLAIQNGDIPQDAAAVIFARPLRDLNAAEIDVLDRYLNRGGALLLLTDVTFNENPFLQQDGAFNRYLWDNFGIQALDAAVVDYLTGQTTPLEIIGAAVFDETDLSANLDPSTYPTLFRLIRAVDVNLEFGSPDVSNGRVIMSSEQSYGETDWAALGQTNTYSPDGDADLRGPLSLAVWAWNTRTNARIFLVGDSDFVSNGLVGLNTALGNGVLFTNAMSWLSRLNEAIEFGAQAFSVSVPIFYTQQQLNTIRFITIFLIPGAVLVTGFAVWARRVRR